MTEFSDRDFGKMLADIEYLKKDQAEMRADIKETNKVLGEILSTLSEAKGHWKALLLFGTACSFIGGTIVKLLGTVKIWP